MKSAPIIAGGALLVLLGTLATAKAPNAPTTVLPLDFRGVRVLEARSTGSLTIEVSNRAPAARYDDREASHVKVRRDGDRLIVDGTLSSETLGLVVPPSVERFVLHYADVESKVPMGRVEVLSDGILSWKGDAARLEIRDTSAPPPRAREAGCECNGEAAHIAVNGGRIGDLRVHSPRAMVQLDDADKIGVAYLWLGPKGSVTINTAQRFEQIHPMPEGAPEPP